MITLALSCIGLIVIDLIQCKQIKKLKKQILLEKKGSAADDGNKFSVIDYTD